MAANDELPRGWLQTYAPAAGVQAIITLLAVFGVAHVVTSIHWELRDNGGGALFNPAITLDGNPIASPILPGGAVQHLSGDWSGKYQGRVGQAVVVQFDAFAAGYGELLVVEGYEV